MTDGQPFDKPSEESESGDISFEEEDRPNDLLLFAFVVSLSNHRPRCGMD
ncbi:MAG: hypothetical protein IIB16_06830 [Chloroflexi bacterium]|nr:hypothetical protein [Chloroflexota bacterium]